MLVRNLPKTRQPTSGLILNRATPLGQTITHFMPLNGDPREVISGTKLTYGVGGVTGLDDRGKSLRGDGVTACASIALDLSGYTKLSISFWLWWDLFSASTSLALEYTPNSNNVNGFVIAPSSGSSRFYVHTRGAAGAENGGEFSFPSSAAWHHYLVTFDRTTGATLGVKAYVDGIQQTLGVVSTADIADNFDNSTLYLFSRGNASLFGAGRMQNLVLRGGYIAGSAEAVAEYQTPWALFAPQSSNIAGVGAPIVAAGPARLRTLMGAGV